MPSAHKVGPRVSVCGPQPCTVPTATVALWCGGCGGGHRPGTRHGNSCLRCVCVPCVGLGLVSLGSSVLFRRVADDPGMLCIERFVQFIWGEVQPHYSALLTPTPLRCTVNPNPIPASSDSFNSSGERWVGGALSLTHTHSHTLSLSLTHTHTHTHTHSTLPYDTRILDSEPLTVGAYLLHAPFSPPFSPV